MSGPDRLTLPIGLLLLIGGLQMLGHLTGSERIRRAGVATTASPLPLVFESYEGFAGLAQNFRVTVEPKDGAAVELAILPRVYSDLEGPFFRRNVYGALLVYGPRTSRDGDTPIVDHVLRHGFCNGPLAKELAVPTPVQRATFTVISSSAAPKQWQHTVECEP